MAQGLLATGELNRSLKALSIAFETYASRSEVWSFHHEAVAHRYSRAHARDLRIPADHGDQVRLRLPRRVRQNLTDEAIETQFDAGRGLLCALHIRQPAEARWHSSFRLPLPVGKNLGLAVREDQCQFVREPLAVVEDFCAVLFLFLPRAQGQIRLGFFPLPSADAKRLSNWRSAS